VTGVDLLADAFARGLPVARQQGFDPARPSHPRTVAGLRQRDEAAEQAGVEERQIAGDDEHGITGGGRERRVDATDRAGVRH